MSATLPTLSAGLAALTRDFSNFASLPDDEQVYLDGADARKLHAILTHMRSLAINLEIELQCYRDMEAGRETIQAVETEATDKLADMLSDGNIIRPDFGGRKS